MAEISSINRVGGCTGLSGDWAGVMEGSRGISGGWETGFELKYQMYKHTPYVKNTPCYLSQNALTTIGFGSSDGVEDSDHDDSHLCEIHHLPYNHPNPR